MAEARPRAIRRLLDRLARGLRGQPDVVPVTELPRDVVPSEAILRRLERLSLRTHRAFQGGPAGEHLGRGQAASLEYADHRAYAPGDDFRRIDWNVLARLDQLTIRVTEPREDMALYLLVDCSASMGTGEPPKGLFARQLAAGLAYLALNQLDAVQVYGVADGVATRFPRYSGRKQSATVFQQIAALPNPRYTDLGTAIAAFLARRPAPGMVVLLSDLLSSADYAAGLRRLVQARFEVAVLHILSPQELDPRLAGDVELIDSETGDAMKISVTADLLGHYRRDLDAWRAQAAATCRGLGIRYVELSTAQPLAEALLLDLRRHGLVA